MAEGNGATGAATPSTSAPANPAIAPSAGSRPKIAGESSDSGSAKGSQAITPKPAPAGTRAPDGRFLPKEGTVGVVKDDAPAELEKQKEEYRFKRKLKVFGTEEDVDLSEDDLAREVQQGRALRKKTKDVAELQARAQRIIELAGNDPEAFLKEAGKDPEEWARQKLANQAKLGAMTEEERQIHELQQKLSRYEQTEKQRTEAEAKATREKRTTELRGQNEAKYQAALEKADLGVSYETVYLMAETEKLALEDGIEMSPDELAKETQHRLDRYTERYLGSLDGRALVKKLGKTRIASILQATLEDFQASQDFSAPAAKQPTSPVAPEEPEKFIDETELNRRMKALRLGR
jgi:hypothetical protein